MKSFRVKDLHETTERTEIQVSTNTLECDTCHFCSGCQRMRSKKRARRSNGGERSKSKK